MVFEEVKCDKCDSPAVCWQDGEGGEGNLPLCDAHKAQVMTYPVGRPVGSGNAAQQYHAMVCLCAGKTQTKTAAEVGVSSDGIGKWLRDPEFRAKLNAMIEETFAEDLQKARRVVRDLMDDPDKFLRWRAANTAMKHWSDLQPKNVQVGVDRENPILISFGKVAPECLALTE